jgi:hypothetical protein
MDGCERNDGFLTVSELAHHQTLEHRKVSRVSRTAIIDDNLRIVLAFVHFWIAYLGLILRTSVMAVIRAERSQVQQIWCGANGYV